MGVLEDEEDDGFVILSDERAGEFVCCLVAIGWMGLCLMFLLSFSVRFVLLYLDFVSSYSFTWLTYDTT